MNNQGLFLTTLVSATIALVPLGSLKSVSAFEQISDRAIVAKPILIARGGGAVVEAGGLAVSAAQLGKDISDIVKASQNREGFVKGMMEKATFAAGSKYNVMVFNMSQSYDRRINGQQYFKQVNYQGVPYGIWIFKDGTFTNKGDGGFINWAFNGKFKRSGNQGHTVKFSKR
jgi:hypothetical protein